MAAARAANPPRARPQRAPSHSAHQPTIGPPRVVEPRKATDHSAMTRPRIRGAAANCRMLLPSEEKWMEAMPTATMATLIVGVIVWGKTHMKELEIDRDLQLQRMEHERKMKELEIEKLKVSRPEL